MEVLMLVGISLAFIIPIVLTFFSSSATRTQALAQVQANSLAQSIADSAGEVWYQGNGSRKIVLVSYPDYLWNVSLSGNYVNFSDPSWKDEFKYRGREITVALAMDDGTSSEVVVQSPAPMANGFSAYPPASAGAVAMGLDQPRAGASACAGTPPVCSGTGHVRPGLVYLIFTNQGDYVNVTRSVG